MTLHTLRRTRTVIDEITVERRGDCVYMRTMDQVQHTLSVEEARELAGILVRAVEEVTR